MINRLICGSAALLVLAPISGAQSIPLDGTWRLARSSRATRPDPETQWTPIKVPQFLSLADERPVMWYQRTFDLPNDWAGRHVFIRFGAVRFVCEVFVNGTKVGGHYGGWESFEIDISRACRFGQSNDLVVRVEDVTALIDAKIDYGFSRPGVRLISQVDDAVMAPIGSRWSQAGICEPVQLIARGDIYVSNVFVKTSVRKQQIEADVTIRNLGDSDRRLRLSAQVESTQVSLGQDDVHAPAGSSVTVTLSRSWNAPKLWGLDEPQLHHLSTRITDGNVQLDHCRHRFGFREFWIEGTKLILNGVPMKFLATAGHPRGQPDDGLSKQDAVDYYKRIREAGCVAMRLHANVWPKSWYEAADEVGMPLILESALFCYSKEYALSKAEFWKNYNDHLRAVLQDHQNHPSIVMISLENEILHCGGDRVEDTEHRLAEAGRLVKRLDPTRPIMYDGDADPEGVADVVNLHYPLDFNQRNLWPQAGRWLKSGMNVSGWPSKFWKWDRRKPLYFGEFLHIQHFRDPDPFTTLIGQEAYLGYDWAMAKTKALAWEMQIEAYRAAGVSGMCPWTLTETGPFPSDDNPRYLAVKRTYQKNAAFIREYDTRFFSGERVQRTIHIFNDELDAADLELRWQLGGDETVDSGSKHLRVRPAESFTLPIHLEMPEVAQRTALTLRLQVLRDDTVVFRDARQYWVFPRRKLSVPNGVRIAVFESPEHVISNRLAEVGARPMVIGDLAKPPDVDVLIIGPHALDHWKSPRGKQFVVGDPSLPSETLRTFVQNGGGIVVLEQDAYPPGLFPAALVDRGCTIAFRRTNDPTLSTGVQEGDFRFWRGDHVVARKTILKPEHGCFRPLVDSGGPLGLVYLPLLELPDGRGRYVLCQLAIGEKLDHEPIAQQMLENLVRRAATPRPPGVRLAVVQDQLAIAERLKDIDATFSDVSGNLDETDLTGFGVLLAETDCPEIHKNLNKIRDFVDGGGKVILHGGTSAGVARLAQIFPESIVAQRSRSVPVSLADRNPVTEGLTNQELYWYGSREGLNWRVRTPLSADVCSHVIVAGRPDPSRSKTVQAESMEVVKGSPRVSQRDVYMYSTATIATTLDFGETANYGFAVRGQGSPLDGVFPEVGLSIDGQSRGSVFVEGEQPGTHMIWTRVERGKHRVSLTFLNDRYDPVSKEDRNLRLDQVSFGPIPRTQSRSLLSPAALVRVPLGQGVCLLDQIRWDRRTCEPEKANRYLSIVLTNLGCPFESPVGAVRIRGGQLLPEPGVKLYRTEDGVAHLGTNGTLGQTVRFGQSRRYRFAVRARGSKAAGQFPHMELSIDGKPLGELRLGGPGWAVLQLEADVSAGEHKIGLSFTNDYYDPPEDRNLDVAHLEIR
jgi:hypothetical protein